MSTPFPASAHPYTTASFPFRSDELCSRPSRTLITLSYPFLTFETHGCSDRNRRCEEIECKTQPSFGFPGKRPSHCGLHKLPGMEDVV